MVRWRRLQKRPRNPGSGGAGREGAGGPCRRHVHDPPCLAAPLRPGKEGARAADSSVPAHRQCLLFASGDNRADDAREGRGRGVSVLISLSSPHRPQLLRVRVEGSGLPLPVGGIEQLLVAGVRGGRLPFAAKCNFQTSCITL